MKTKLLLIIAFALCVNMFSQIPNNGFENWNNAGAYLDPAGWWTPNYYATGSYYPVTRSTDHYPSDVGNYSIRLENNTALLPGVDAFGLTWTGDALGSDYPVFPVVGHPNSFCGYYKFSPLNNDTMEIHVILYKNGLTVGGGYFKSAAAAPSWSSFNVPISPYIDADSARIMILSCYDNDSPSPHGNSVLYMDNLSFDNLITGIAGADPKTTISVFPNPIVDQLNISFPTETDQQNEIEILNILGSTVYKQKVFNTSGSASINVSQLREGIYFIRLLAAGRQIYEKKIVIVKK